jgi:L-ascorbate metabolism protein UlaG (beta-lactamase superfamily)
MNTAAVNTEPSLADDEQGLYLKEDVYFEPLIHQWYAWPYLLPPMTRAMNITGRNMRLMKSFISNYQLHISASKTAGLAGGDFVNCTEEQVDDVRKLVDRIETQYSDYAEIRKAITALNEILANETGMSLEGLYEKVPAMLRGYVELVYDMNHHASFRLIEGLIYESKLFAQEAQSVAFGLLSRVRERPFVLSSPRFPDANHLHIDLPFSDASLDTIFSARTKPVSLAHIRKHLLDRQSDRQCQGGLALEDLFTPNPPRQLCPQQSSDLRIRYLGHAGLLIETRHTNVMVDPVIASRDNSRADNIISHGELPDRIDYICLTHTHMDHVCIESLLQLRHKTRQILVPKNSGGSLADPSIKLMLQKIGFDVRECEDMEEVACVDGRIKAIPFLGEHADLNIRSKTAWYFEFAGKKIFSGADSSSLDATMYERIHRVIGDVDFLFIGMECVGAPMSWLYGALFTKPIPRAINESRRFNGSDFASAKKIVEIFKPSEVYIYALGMEPCFKYFMGMDYSEDAKQIKESDQLIEFCAARGIRADRLFSRHVWCL